MESRKIDQEVIEQVRLIQGFINANRPSAEQAARYKRVSDNAWLTLFAWKDLTAIPYACMNMNHPMPYVSNSEMVSFTYWWNMFAEEEIAAKVSDVYQLAPMTPRPYAGKIMLAAKKLLKRIPGDYIGRLKYEDLGRLAVAVCSSNDLDGAIYHLDELIEDFKKFKEYVNDHMGTVSR